ncbi:MAG: glycosyltransferase [Bacteroidia bacterium]|nr:glycosyltransferase [Bacteroidia bacterium]
MDIEKLLPVFGPLDYAFCGALVVLTFISWYYHFGVFNKIKKTNLSPSSANPVSLVIAARNELQNLQKNLPLWLAQNHPNFEVIVADDGSTDGTSEWIVQQMEFEPKLKLVFLDPQYVKMHGKKIAITLAYKKAKHNQFLLTDADCTPASEDWLGIMTAPLMQQQVCIGFSPYYTNKGLLNALIRYETLVSALNCFGFAFKGKPYMGVGRNLAYTRNIYDKVNGFSTHSHIPAGDDDLFVQSAATQANTALCLQPDAFTYSIPKTTWSAWWKQKQRHLWTGKFYKSDIKRMLSVFPIVQLLFFVNLMVWALLGAAFWYPLTLLVLKFIPEWIVKGKKSALFVSKDLRPWIPFLSAIYLCFYVMFGISAFFARKPKW